MVELATAAQIQEAKDLYYKLAAKGDGIVSSYQTPIFARYPRSRVEIANIVTTMKAMLRA